MTRREPSTSRSATKETSRQIRRAQNGEQAALDWVCRRFTGVLLGYAESRMSPDLRDYYPPQEVVHDAWLPTLKRLSNLRPNQVDHITPVLLRFLSTTITNVIKAKNRKRKKAATSLNDHPDSRDSGSSPAPDPVSREPDPLRRVIASEARGKILRALQSLKPEDREVIYLRKVEGLSPEETAKRLGFKADIVNLRLNRAMKRLKDRLPPDSFIQEILGLGD